MKFWKKLTTPTSEQIVPDENFDIYDGDPELVAIFRSWSEPGINPEYHEEMKRRVREWMPLLGRALDRLENSTKEK